MSEANLKVVTDFPAMLKNYLPEIQRALPKHLNGDRMARIALTAFRRAPKLAYCNPASVFAAVIQASQLGLEPDTLGRAFLIPYGAECQFVPGWKGLVDLLNQSGKASAWTGAVFAGDEFDYALGDSPYVKHKPMGESDPAKITHVYAIGRMNGNNYPIIEAWPIARVVKHRNRYNKVGDKHYSYSQWEMYARKVVLLQVLKYLPASAELQQAITLNDAAEIGRQGLTVTNAIDGTWTPMADMSAPELEQARPTITPYPDEKLNANLPTWRGIVAGGGKTPDDIIKTVKSKHTLTPEQEKKIKDLARPVEEVPPVDAEWIADYDKKENARS